MKRHRFTTALIAIVFAVGGGIAASAQLAAAQSAPDPSPTYETITVPRGTEFEATLNQELSTKHNQVGDRFTATLDRPLTDGRRVFLPAGARIHGEVIAAGKSRNSGEKELRVAVNAISFDGNTYTIRATITEARARKKGPSAGSTALKIGGGAAIGAILGRVIGGNSKGTLIGAAAGAVAGTAIALGTGGSHAVIDEGSVLIFRLDEPLVIQRRVTPNAVILGQ